MTSLPLPPEVVEFRRNAFIGYTTASLLSVLGDLAILVFLGLAYRAQPSLLRPTHLKLLLFLVTANMVGMIGHIGIFGAEPDSFYCSFTGFLVLGGMCGDFTSALVIVWVLYQSLVLFRPPFTRRQEIGLFAFLIGFVTTWCGLSIGQNPRSIQVFIANIGTIVNVLLTFLFVIITLWQLWRGAFKKEAHQVKRHSQAQPMDRTVELVSRRIILYPCVTLVVGGMGFIQNMFPSSDLAQFLGQYIILLSGVLHGLIFFFADPSMTLMKPKVIHALRMEGNPQIDTEGAGSTGRRILGSNSTQPSSSGGNSNARPSISGVSGGRGSISVPLVQTRGRDGGSSVSPEKAVMEATAMSARVDKSVDMGSPVEGVENVGEP
ncbi:hypothetical protein HDU93_005544 [Gonapodya sp. JEL0774]|nr:hypothetical protein HDU93_005544 [Gonapodya sp. JEL0774]